MENFIVLGLLAAASWGVGDFLSAGSSRKTSPKHTLFWVVFFDAVLWIIYSLLSGQLSFPPLDAVFLAFLVGLCLHGGDFIFNLSSTRGKISVASPLLSLAGLFSIIFALVLLGENPTPLQVAFGVMLVLGGILVGLKSFKLREIEANAPIMLLAAIMHGFGFMLAKTLVGRFGVVAAATWFFVSSGVVLLPLLYWRFSREIGKPFAENVGGGLCYFVGFFAFVSALSTDLLALAAPVSQLFPLFTVTLAFLFCKERLQKHQLTGVALAALALAGLSL